MFIGTILTKIIAGRAITLALFLGIESVTGAVASAVLELLATVVVRIEVPFLLGSRTGSRGLGQQAHMLAGVFLTGVLALGLAVEAIVVTLASTIPESSASSVGNIEEVLDTEVGAVARFLGQAAGLLRRLLDILASSELLVRRLGNSIGTAAKLAFQAGASLAIRSLGRCLLVIAALELGL